MHPPDFFLMPKSTRLVVLMEVLVIMLMTGIAAGQDIEQPTADRVGKWHRFKTNWKLPYPNPYRSAVYSMALPGSGQVYNRRYWKVPLVVGGFGALVYSADYNKGFRDRFNVAFGLASRNLEHEFRDRIDNPETLRRWRNRFDKNLQMTYIGFVAFYAFTTLDAYTDAHLKNFDISDDLSLHISPSIQPLSGGASMGIGLRFKL